MGVVKYIGETEFAPGEWIGVAFDKPFGKVWISKIQLFYTPWTCRETQWNSKRSQVF